MIYAIFSDVHSNLEALASVLKDAREEGAEQFICLGDIIGIGASPVECIEILRETSEIVVAGEFDRITAGEEIKQKIPKSLMETLFWSRKLLRDEHIEWLRSLPLEQKVANFRLTHGSLNQLDPWQRIHSIVEASDHFDFQKESLCFVGHSHLQSVFQLDAISEKLTFHELSPKPLVKTLITVGSVGRPQDNNPHAAYVLYNQETNLIVPKRVAYDVRSAQLKMKEAGFDINLIKALASGK